MKKKRNYAHKMIMEFTPPTGKTVYMRATAISNDKEIMFEGQLKEVGRTIKRSLPKNYHTDYREDTNKYYWYYLGRKEGKKDYTSNKYFINHEDAVNDAIKYYNDSKKK